MRCPHVRQVKVPIRSPTDRREFDAHHDYKVKRLLQTPMRTIEVPCGKCPICLRNRQLDWVMRLVYENKASKSSLFITLTYSDENLPVDSDTHLPHLDKRHCQLFIKRVRKKYPTANIRYYFVGEYGGDTYRPHYHAILFNLPFKHIKDAEKDIAELWNRGFVYVRSVTNGRIAYCAKYSNKIDTGDDTQLHVDDEFMICSTKPYIGQYYVDTFKDLHMANLDKNTTFGKIPRRLPRIIKEKLKQYAFETDNLSWIDAQDYVNEKFMKSQFDLYLEWKESHPNYPLSNYNPYAEEQQLIAKVREEQRKKRKQKF